MTEIQTSSHSRNPSDFTTDRVYTWMLANESLVDDRLCRGKKPVWSGCERLWIESWDSSNIRGDLTDICGFSIQLPDVSAIIIVTRCKFPRMSSRMYRDECWTNISIRHRVLPHDFHSSPLRELSTKGFVDEHPHINPATELSQLTHRTSDINIYVTNRTSYLPFVCPVKGAPWSVQWSLDRLSSSVGKLPGLRLCHFSF